MNVDEFKNCFLDESNAEEFAVKNNVIQNLFDSITSLRTQSSEKSRIFSSIEVWKTFDEMSKNKRISNEMSVKCALSKNSIEILFKSNKENLDIIAVVKQTLRKRNALQNMKSVERTMHKKNHSQVRRLKMSTNWVCFVLKTQSLIMKILNWKTWFKTSSNKIWLSKHFYWSCEAYSRYFKKLIFSLYKYIL